MNNSKVLLALPLAILLLLSLPQNFTNKIRSKMVMAFSPLQFNSVPEAQELKSLRLENHQLRAQLDQVYEWIGSEKRLREQADLFRLLNKEKPNDYFLRRSNEMRSLLQKQAMASSARIVYRDPSSWSSSCWIDVGEENNQALGQTIIAKNSPVVSGSSLIGIVEYVGRRQSRVRFITDSGLKTAVRAIRGSVLDREIATLSHALVDRLKKHSGVRDEYVDALNSLQETLPIRWQDGFFAKGELCGSSAPYFRSVSSTLKGVGFNCDFKDSEGPERDLRSGILKAGDLLITSGLDGVFPPGLKVAIVTKIDPLRAGAFAYDLEATPIVPDLSDITFVHVLPPAGE